jgi:hypothetical protein
MPFRPLYALLAGAVLLGLAACPVSAQKLSERAKVTSPSLQIYSQPSFQSQPVAQLKAGDTVRIVLQVSSPEGSWCNIHAAAGSGYVKCSELSRQPQGGRKPASPPPPRSLFSEDCGNGYGNTWQERYNLTSAQLAAGRALADRLGVTRCGERAAQFQQAFHSVGVSAQTMDRLRDEWWAQERQNHCAENLQLFLQQLQNSVSAQQKELLEADRKEVHRLAATGQIALFCAF